MPATLHILTGKIASGKSTLARQLAAEPDTVLLSEDNLLSTLYEGDMNTVSDYVRNSARLREGLLPHIVELLNTDRHAKVRFIDAGVTHGKHRFPTRSYVEAWLGDDEADLRPWRVMVLVALAFAGVAAAILFGVTGEIPI